MTDTNRFAFPRPTLTKVEGKRLDRLEESPPILSNNQLKRDLESLDAQPETAESQVRRSLRSSGLSGASLRIPQKRLSTLYASFLNLSNREDVWDGHKSSIVFGLSIVLSVLTFLALLLVPCYVLPALLVQGVEVAKPVTADIKFALYVSGLSTIPIGLFLLLAMNRGTSFFFFGDDEMESPAARGDRLRSLQTPILIMLAVLLFHLKEMSVIVAQQQFQTTTTNLLDRAKAITMFSALVSLLGDVNLAVVRYADKLDTCAGQSEKSKKWLGIMKNFSRFHDYDIDSGYVIPGGSRSPARVLSEIVCVYCNIGKLMGVTLLVLFLVGVDMSSTLVIIGLTVVFTSMIFALHINEALGNVLPLAMSNAFHVGEIVSIARTGFTPGDAPTTHLTGFVEGVTWGHVIIRDFRKKQVFIPHAGLDKMQIANWARRPSKMCFFRLPVTPGLSGGAAPLAMLAKAVRDWIAKHKGIDQTCYTKSCIKLLATEGLILEVIFYPVPGKKARVIRSEFIVMVMDVARRLDICVTRAEIRTSMAWVDSNVDRDINALDLADVMPSDELTLRSGFEPKRKKL